MPEKTIYVHLDFIKSGYNTFLAGRLTQLVECHPYKVEVTGSSPVSPTIKTFLFILLCFIDSSQLNVRFLK